MKADNFRRAFKRAKHDTDASVLAQVRDGLDAAAYQFEISDAKRIENCKRAEALRREVHMPIIRARRRRDEEDVLRMDEIGEMAVDAGVRGAHGQEPLIQEYQREETEGMEKDAGRRGIGTISLIE